MAERMQGALADLLREIGRMDRRLEALQAAETGTGGGGAGTVTSVALSLPAILTVSGSPVTTAGTLTAVLATQSANRVFAGPTSGGAAAPTFRALVAADIPALPYGTGTVTSVALSLPAILTVSGSPVTTAGTLTAVLAEQYANLVFAGPVSGVGTSTPTFRALVAADLPAGTGTVTSVALSLPAILTVSGSPVTTAGTLTAVLATQAANLVWAGPATGAAAAPTFRALVAADIPALAYGTGTVTSVALSLPAILTVSGSPVTTAGTLTAVLATQAANLVWAGPATGAAAAPTFRALAAADLPAALNNAIALITADRTALVTDRTILADPTAGDVYIRLPAAASMANIQMWIKRRNGTANAVHMVANALELIEGHNGGSGNAWTLAYTGTHASMLIQSNGSGWYGLIGQGTITAAAPECDIEQPAGNPVASGGTVDYGTVVVGVGSAKTFTVKNTGVANLGISAAAVAGGNASDFAVNTGGMASVVAGPAGSTTFAVTFTPAASGARSTTLTVTNTDASEGSYTITLTGTGSGVAYDWAPWAVYTMASMQAGAQAGAGDNGISWFNQAT